jgi:hypothetical protein
MRNPYTDPATLWERLTFPSLAVAYEQGLQEANDLGILAMQCGFTEETLAAAAKHYVGSGEYMSWHRILGIAQAAVDREVARNRSGVTAP